MVIGLRLIFRKSSTFNKNSPERFSEKLLVITIDTITFPKSTTVFARTESLSLSPNEAIPGTSWKENAFLSRVLRGRITVRMRHRTRAQQRDLRVGSEITVTMPFRPSLIL